MANNKARQRNENIIPVQDLIFHCISKWYWFVITICIALLMAVLYILTTPPMYVRSTEILFKEESKGSTSSGSGSFKEIGSSQLVSKTSNEIKALLSPGVMSEVVERLKLDIEQRTEGRFFDLLVYGHRPMEMELPDLSRKDIATFTAVIKNDSCITLSSFVKNGKEFSTQPIVAHIGDTLHTPLGRVFIKATGHFYYFEKNKEIFVEKQHFEATVNEFCSNLSAILVNEESSIVRLSIKDISTLRATDILNAITAIYNEKWIEESNKAIFKTADFIQSRIDELGSELREIDRRVATFKSRNKLTESSVNNSAVTQVVDSRQLELNSQLELAKFIKSHLNTNGKKDVIPANTGINIPGIEALIANYNENLLSRNRLAANSSDTNPIVMDYDKKVSELYTSITSAVDIYIDNISRELNLAKREVASEIYTFSTSTEQIKDLQALIRQQKIKNTLYLFLLQKLEEIKLSQEFTATNNRTLIPVGGSNTPIEPRQRQSIMLALVVGILAPIVFIFVREITNRKVRGRKDIENIKVPFVGEIPQYAEKGKKPKKGSNSPRRIVVKDGKRNVINEAFRVLRTNIEFMNDKDKKSQVIILTSFNPGSGKTFLTMNIGASLAIKGKKVLVIDGDLRHGSASEYAGKPSIGISSYLSGATNDVKSIIVAPDEYPGLHIIPVGETPPNPTELLHGDKFRKLIQSMQEEYDYILIDCPPIDIVADTQIIEENAHRTLFVIRAGLLNRDMLYELEDIYTEKRFKNMATILNGTYSSQGHYGYRYGYSYGYGYGYGYGYHYHQKK